MDTAITHEATISLPQVCIRLGLTWRQSYDLLLRGQLRGEQRCGRWYVDVSSVESLERERTANAERVTVI